MISFEVKDMTCGHCVSAITKAVQALDAQATVQIDLVHHRVDIHAGATQADALSAAIQAAGYTPVALPSEAVPAGAKTASGCGGGCACH